MKSMLHCQRRILLTMGCVLPIALWYLVSRHGLSRDDQARAVRLACIRNIQGIIVAKDVYATVHGLTNGATIPGNALVRGAHLRSYVLCPLLSAHVTNTAEGMSLSYDIGRVGELPRCRLAPQTHCMPHHLPKVDSQAESSVPSKCEALRSVDAPATMPEGMGRR